MKTVVLFLVFFAYFMGGFCQSCGPLKEFKECGTACPTTCSNFQRPRICIQVCVRGCFCINGFVLLGNKCVRPNQCPRIGPIPRIPKIILCGQNETTSLSSYICRTCDSVCVEPVNEGCTCKPNYLLNRLTGQCVLPMDCPNVDPSPNCQANELFVKCKSPCPPTCSRPNLQLCPILKCYPGCTCKLPFVRDDVTGRCIRRENCPGYCGENAIRTLCVPRCQETCQHPYPRPCSGTCVPGCMCRTGYIMDERYGTCILPQQCPLFVN